MTLYDASGNKDRLDQELHDDFLRMDEEAARYPYDEPLQRNYKTVKPDDALLQETNQDGLMRGHTAF